MVESDRALKEAFAMFGVPTLIRSDNGPPFNSTDFKKYAEEEGFTHRRITPAWPRANGICERFMRNLGKVIRNAKIDNNGTWEDELLEFLRNYRATPHASTKMAPNQLLLKTKSRTSKPPANKEGERDTMQIVENDNNAKRKMKENADIKNRAQEANIKKGDKVLLKQQKTRKYTAIYDPTPFTVESTHGTQATIVRGNQTLKRNMSLLKRINNKQQAKIKERSTTQKSKTTYNYEFVEPPSTNNAQEKAKETSQTANASNTTTTTGDETTTTNDMTTTANNKTTASNETNDQENEESQNEGEENNIEDYQERNIEGYRDGNLEDRQEGTNNDDHDNRIYKTTTRKSGRITKPTERLEINPLNKQYNSITTLRN
jgi:hypothetical protein